jgi:hypothetical protein
VGQSPAKEFQHRFFNDQALVLDSFFAEFEKKFPRGAGPEGCKRPAAF